MKFAKITTLLAAATFVASVGVAQAQVDKANAKCRATAQKNTGKLTATASKAVVGCWKGVFKTGSFANCNDSATADTKGKISKTATKLTSAVGGAKSKCDNTDHAAALAEYQDCPSPGTSGTGMTTFAQVGTCLADIGQVMADNMHRYAMNPTPSQVIAIAGHANLKQIAKCGNSIQKNYSKLIATIGKVEGKEQATLDKGGNAYNYGAAGLDTKGKISKTVGKLNSAIGKDCGPLTDSEFGLLGTCGRSAADVGACLEKTARNGSGGVTQVSFDMPGICPSLVFATVKPGQTNSSTPGAKDGATTTSTQVDAGWVGFGHDNDFASFTAAGGLSCTDGTCSDCSPSISCLAGNCRCTNDITVACDEPLVADVNDLRGHNLPRVQRRAVGFGDTKHAGLHRHRVGLGYQRHGRCRQWRCQPPARYQGHRVPRPRAIAALPDLLRRQLRRRRPRHLELLGQRRRQPYLWRYQLRLPTGASYQHHRVRPENPARRVELAGAFGRDHPLHGCGRVGLPLRRLLG